MPSQSPQQQWSLVYYKKKAQFNQYIQFKTKSFQYQKLLSKLHFLSNDDEQTQRKQVKQYIKSLNETIQEMRNIFSEIQQEMKFLRLQNLVSLVQGVQQLVMSVHHFTIEDFKNRLQYGQKNKEKDEYTDMTTCQKCLGSINQLNLKRMYDEITATESTVQDETLKMTKQDRKKMISQLDQYDILLAQKQNYLRKVNAVLESKGKIGELSNHDKTYNFLSQYLSKLQKIQQRKSKNQTKTDPNKQEQDRKWEEESYKHILQYIKRVLFEHFVNQCSGPVKKMFQKINIDKLFKSFTDHANAQMTVISPATMQNHQTQTINIPEVEQLKMIERKMQFKTKEISMIKTNKDQLQKKYMSTLELNRKIQGDMFEIKKQKKWLQSEVKVAQQSLKNLNEKYQQAVKNYQQDQRKTIESYINQRQRILRASKIMQNDYMTLGQQHKKCLKTRNVPKEFANSDTQTYLLQFPDDQQLDDQNSTSRNEPSPLKRRKSKMNRMLHTSISGQKKNGVFFKEFDKSMTTMFEAYQNDSISEKDQKQSKAESRFQIESHVVDEHIGAQDEKQSSNMLTKRSKINNQQKSMTRLIKQKSGQREFNNQSNPKMQRILTEGDQKYYTQNITKNGKRIKMSMTSFKKQRRNQQQQIQQGDNLQGDQKSLLPYKFSNFNNRYTQGDQSFKAKNMTHNITSPQLYPGLQKQTEMSQQQKNAIGNMVSDRLYSQRKRKQSKELPFQRVFENGKQKFYIKKISRQSINYQKQKQRMKQISQILKPYVYNNNNVAPSPPKRSQSRTNLKTIRQRMSWLSQKRLSTDGKDSRQKQDLNQKNQQEQEKATQILSQLPVKNIGHDILSVQHIIESEYAYLKAVGFIDFLMKIGKQNKKMVKTISKIQHQVKEKFKSPSQSDLQLFGGRHQAEDYIKSKNFWTLEDIKENMMIYNKNDGLSSKVQKYFTLLKRANPQLYTVLMKFLIDPIFAVFGKKVSSQQMHYHRPNDNNFIRDIFNQLQKYHKIKHNQCTHIVDFLEKIGFYKYTYF